MNTAVVVRSLQVSEVLYLDGYLKDHARISFDLHGEIVCTVINSCIVQVLQSPVIYAICSNGTQIRTALRGRIPIAITSRDCGILPCHVVPRNPCRDIMHSIHYFIQRGDRSIHGNWESQLGYTCTCCCRNVLGGKSYQAATSSFLVSLVHELYSRYGSITSLSECLLYPSSSFRDSCYHTTFY